MDGMITFGYGLALSMICLFSFVQLYLIVQYRKSKKPHLPTKKLILFPDVTIQLPIYNEKYVVERLIDAVCQLDYPKDKLEVQVLDDSDDETRTIVAKKVKEWAQKGVSIKQICRNDRDGFKAGALQYGLESAKGEYIAIFDADFLPPPHFLLSTLPHFDPTVGMVQTRWGHLNEDYNWFTRMQAFGLNAHFTVEQSGRQASGRLINFNGTGGVWRKACIDDAGGWESDTLTEDLDLSYRAQLKGWNFRYLEEIVSPAELPVVIHAIKSQQYRWNKGAAETAMKHIPHILRSKMNWGNKLHGIAHLLNSSLFLWLFIAAFTSVPLLHVRSVHHQHWFWSWSSLFICGFLIMVLFYWTASKKPDQKTSLFGFLKNLPVFIAFSGGLSFHNSVAVTQGYLGIRSPFIRTPKFNILSKSDRYAGNDYDQKSISFVTIVEGFLSLYFLFGAIQAFVLQDFGFILWHLMLTIGFGLVFYKSVKPIKHA